MTTTVGGSVPLTDAALRLGVSYWPARDMLFRGQLRGGKDLRGRYYVDPELLREVAEERRARSE